MFAVEITIKEHRDQRYDTVGDWQLSMQDQTLRIYVSGMKNWKYEALVAVHELVEAILCMTGGVNEKEVDEFDLNFKGEGEPGDHPDCPYRSQHFIATTIERILAVALNVNWGKYTAHINQLVWRKN